MISFVGTFPDGQPWLDGAELARLEVEAGVAGRYLELRAVPAGDDPVAALTDAVGRSAAVLFQGPGSVVSSARAAIEEVGTPVVLLEGDLYSDRALFAQVFQASPPLLWQARELARYLAVRGETEATLVIGGPAEGTARAAWASAAAEEGVTTAAEVRAGGDGQVDPAALDGRPAVVLGPHAIAAGTVAAAATLPDPPQVLASSDLLRRYQGGPPPPGTVAVGAYTWSGWAEPIPRVAEFRAGFREAFGGFPFGPQQEGYDAMRVLIRGLGRTVGEGGESLVTALEGIGGGTFSSLPIAFGPDDRTFVDELRLGVFAIPDPDEPTEAWLQPDVPWRPVMRSFTSDGERTIVLERDRAPFWPNWRPPAPSPKYRSSRLGITTDPDDPLH